MKKYYITITETLERTIEIIANDENEATDMAEEQYKNGEIVLDYEDHIDTDYSTYKIEELESENKENEEI